MSRSMFSQRYRIFLPPNGRTRVHWPSSPDERNLRFGRDASVLGKSVQIHKTFFTIIGVTPPEFFGETVGDSPDSWLPMMMEPLVNPGRDWLHDDASKAE